MSYIARCHPLCGWLRLQPQDYARTMQELLKQRDDYLLIKPDHSGPAPGYCAWVWDVELPQLANNPYYAAQIEQQVQELLAESATVEAEISPQAAALQQRLDRLNEQIDVLEAAIGHD